MDSTHLLEERLYIGVEGKKAFANSFLAFEQLHTHLYLMSLHIEDTLNAFMFFNKHIDSWIYLSLLGQ